MTERIDGMVPGYVNLLYPDVYILPDTFYDTKTIAALGNKQWVIDIPNDEFYWYLGDLGCYRTPTGWNSASLYLNGTLIFGSYALYYNHYPAGFDFLYACDMGKGLTPMRWRSARIKRPFVLSYPDELILTVFNVSNYQITVGWIATFYRRPQ